MCSSTSQGVHTPSFQSQLISFYLGDNSVNTWPLFSTRDREKWTRWLQWEGKNSNLTDCWHVLPQGWTIKILLAWEKLIIILQTGISKRNIFCWKKKKYVVVNSNIHDKFVSSNLTYKFKIKKKRNRRGRPRW